MLVFELDNVEHVSFKYRLSYFISMIWPPASLFHW